MIDLKKKIDKCTENDSLVIKSTTGIGNTIELIDSITPYYIFTKNRKYIKDNFRCLDKGFENLIIVDVIYNLRKNLINYFISKKFNLHFINEKEVIFIKENERYLIDIKILNGNFKDSKNILIKVNGILICNCDVIDIEQLRVILKSTIKRFII
jgi:hypothetical protein